MDNIVNVSCHYHAGIREVAINLDEYVFFELDYRGKNNWHIKGHKCDGEKNWETFELSEYGVCNVSDLASFIKKANEYGKAKHQPCKVSRFNNLHYSASYYEELTFLLGLLNLKHGER